MSTETVLDLQATGKYSNDEMALLQGACQTHSVLGTSVE